LGIFLNKSIKNHRKPSLQVVGSHGYGSRVLMRIGLLGSPPSTETTGERPPTVGFQSWPPIMEDRVLTGLVGYTHGSQVSLPGLVVTGHGLHQSSTAGNSVAGSLSLRLPFSPDLSVPSLSVSASLSLSL